jgi:hypothetical protein
MDTQREELNTSLEKGSKSPRIGPLNGLGPYSAFFIYESIISLASLFFLSLGIIIRTNTISVIDTSSPAILFLSVSAVSAFKLYIAYGLLNNKQIAWKIAIGVLLVSFIGSFFQIFGGLPIAGIGWLVARFETGNNIITIISLFYSGLIVRLTVAIPMTALYGYVLYKLYHSRHRVISNI